MKKLFIVLFILALCSCGPDLSKRDAILKPYIDKYGQPTSISEQKMPKTTFYRYEWTLDGYKKLELSESSGEWKEVGFTEYQ